MAVFNINTDFSNETDVKKIQSYLQKLNKQLQYMFSNIDPENNYSSSALAKYEEDQVKVEYVNEETKALSSELTAEVTRATMSESNLANRITQNTNNISLKVNSSDLGNNSLTIRPAALEIESGMTIDIKDGSTFVVVTDNFSIDENGDVEISGTFNDLASENGYVHLYEQPNTQGAIRLDKSNGSYTFSSGTNVLSGDFLLGSDLQWIEGTGWVWGTQTSVKDKLDEFEQRISALEGS